MDSSVASWGGEKRRDWGSVGEDPGSPLLLGSAETVKDWDGDSISGLASEGSWQVGCFPELVASEGWGLCRGSRDRDWGSGGLSSSTCQLDLPGMSGWVGMGDGQFAGFWMKQALAGWMDKWGRTGGPGNGGLTRLRQLSKSSLWQQSKLWLGRRLLVRVALVLRLSNISLSRSSSSPDPRKLPSSASSAHRS